MANEIKNESAGNAALIRAAMSLLGKAGRGKSKRRDVDYSALARKAHASRARNKTAPSAQA